MAETKRDGEAVEHVDQSLKQLEAEGEHAPTAEEEARVIRKLDWRLMPMIFLIYMLSVLDRSNLGNAYVAGLTESIDLSGTRYAMLGTVFYISYLIFQGAAVGWKHFPAHIWVSCIVFAWGTISSLQAAAQNYGGLIALRVLLGAGEACYAGVPVYLSFFYPRDRVGFRQGIFLSGSALANAYGGALGYAILLIKSHIASWRILFLIEGLPTLIVAAAAFFVFPDDIRSASFLNEREKFVCMHMVKRGQVADTENHTGLRMNDFLAAFTDWRSYLPGLMYFGCNVSFASLPLFVPTIIAEIGTFSRIQANGLSAPPYLLTFIIIIITAFVSDRVRRRGPFVAVFGIVSAIGFLLLATTEAAAPRYLGVYLAITIFVCVAILIPWCSNTHATESKRAGGWAIFAIMGQCGPVLDFQTLQSWKDAAFVALDIEVGPDGASEIGLAVTTLEKFGSDLSCFHSWHDVQSYSPRVEERKQPIKKGNCFRDLSTPAAHVDKNVVLVGFSMKAEFRFLEMMLPSFANYIDSWIDLQQITQKLDISNQRRWKPALSNCMYVLGLREGFQPKSSAHSAANDALPFHFFRKTRKIKNYLKARNHDRRRFWKGRPKPFDEYPYVALVSMEDGYCFGHELNRLDRVWSFFTSHEPTALGWTGPHYHGHPENGHTKGSSCGSYYVGLPDRVKLECLVEQCHMRSLECGRKLVVQDISDAADRPLTRQELTTQRRENAEERAARDEDALDFLDSCCLPSLEE
ncbi:putative Major facilitator superfamily domain-containing protein [Seiridium cardinale]|uniref:Major facilitator superfamily domain-containing protein n=1 Tax=Seiridium cardinale TaxID=138064 RepID=A0ABR2Y497_9PEZI